MGKYCKNSDVAEMVRTAQLRVVFGDDEPNPGTNDVDISNATVDRLIDQVEANMESRFARFYAVPLALIEARTSDMVLSIATRFASYRVYSLLNPTMASDDLPAAVTGWRDEAEEIMLSILPKGKTAAEIGRDVILEGESLNVGSGDAGSPAIAFSTKLPYGGTTS